jgi:hypothetical protein
MILFLVDFADTKTNSSKIIASERNYYHNNILVCWIHLIYRKNTEFFLSFFLFLDFDFNFELFTSILKVKQTFNNVIKK